MFRIFGFLVLVGALTFASIQLADNPGRISVEWLGYRIDTYFGVALLALLVGLYLLLIVYRLIRGVLGLPGGFLDRRAAKRRDDGVSALSLGMAAIAAGDAEEARKQARRAERLLDDPSKTRILSAQAAALGGDTEAAGRYFDALIESPETKFVGLTGKLRQALETGDREAALALARQARNLRPDSGFAARTLFTLETEAEDWDEAQKTLFDAVRRDLIPEDEAKRYRIAIDMERARLQEVEGRMENATDFALRVLKVDPAFAPAVKIVVASDVAKGRTRKAQKLLEEGWKEAPHPSFARLYADLWPEDDLGQRLKRVEKLVGERPASTVGRIAFAEAAVAAENWSAARAALDGIPPAERSAGIYRLQAYLAQAEDGNATEARAMLERASAAAPDPTWTCSDCGATAEVWTVSCGNCGHFASLSWKQPPRVSTLVSLPPEAEAVPAVPEELLIAAEPDSVEAPAPDPAPEPEPEVTPEPEAPTAEDGSVPPAEAKKTKQTPNPEDVVRRLA
ncbi:heme biosynthesis protein HemY [Nisaea acidiphila]|uniref:Heme biosynthesis protein HemY n=1 Tax=Nisaea acidiphila TaxID=1862145 RepID=A0A9J7APJ8_9PROT|nr:heme biosynthesis HemY N-terminal domain-containing protein [Nisaea acidiphila]UUX48521.1 heme biosynthesis protein HemY [Nisaea acidiphila]